jgi:hypothetical protein
VVFPNKRKHNKHKFYFEGNILEEVADYKYLVIDFNRNLSWDGLYNGKETLVYTMIYTFDWSNCVNCGG